MNKDGRNILARYDGGQWPAIEKLEYSCSRAQKTTRATSRLVKANPSGHPLSAHFYHRKIFDLENKGQGHEVQQLQWSRFMENINLYKVIFEHFALVLTVFQIVTFQISRYIENVGQGHDVQHLQWRYKTANT